MNNTLTGPAAALAAHMSDISEDVYAAAWLINTEWTLWQALLDWRATSRAYWSPGSLYPQEITEDMPELDRLQRESGGWVWWLEGDNRGEVFVAEERWLRLVDARKRSATPVANEELDVMIR